MTNTTGAGEAMTQRRLPPEVKEKLKEALKMGVEKGYGYHRIWRMLKENGVEVSRSTIRNYYYKSFPVKLKKTKKSLPRELRIKLYYEVKRLRRQRLSYNMIIDKVYKSFGVRLSYSVVSYWCRNIFNPFNGCRIPSIDFLEPSPELSYVIGVVAGDGWVEKVKKKNGGYEYRIGVKAKDRDFVEEFSRCVGRVLSREPPELKQVEEGKFLVRVDCKVLYELLRKPISIDKIAPFVEHCEECMRSFLRAFFDSEGYVSKKGEVYCYNTDLQLIKYIMKILNLLGIKTTGIRATKRRTKKNKICYFIYIKMQHLLKFSQLVGFTIQRKRKRLEESLKKRELLTT